MIINEAFRRPNIVLDTLAWNNNPRITQSLELDLRKGTGRVRTYNQRKETYYQ